MQQHTDRSLWLMAVSSIVFLGAAFVTLRAAEVTASARSARPDAISSRAAEHATPAPADQPAANQPERPAPSAPEESATIFDDPTAAPDQRQSADHDVRFPVDI